MSKYTDIATGRSGTTLPIIKKPAVQFPTAPKAVSPMQSPEMQDYLKQGYENIDQKYKEQIRNPVSYKLMEGGTKLSNKVLGKGWASDFIGALPGGILRTLERPIRSLMGAGYGIGTGVAGLTGSKEHAENFNQNINPFMTPEDMAAMKTNDPKVPLKYGGKLAADALNWIIGPMKGVSLPTKMLVGGGVSGAGTFAEDKPTLRSVAQNTLTGMAATGALHFAGKGVSKLRSGKVPGKAPTIEAPRELSEGSAPKQLPAPSVPKNIPPEKIISLANQADNAPVVQGKPGEVVPRTPAIEGEIVDKTGLVKQEVPGQVKTPAIEAFEPIKKQLVPGETSVVGLKSLLNKFGTPGKKLSVMLDEFENQAHTLSNTSFNRFQQAFKNFQTVAKNSKTPMAGNDTNIVQYILDEYNHKPHTVNISPQEKSVAESFFKDLTLPASLEAQRFNLKPNGKNIGPARMFLPLIIKDTTKFAKSMMERLVGQGKSEAEAAEIIDHMIKGTEPKAKTPIFAGFEKARNFNPTTFDELSKFGYETDLNKIAAVWSKGAWRRIAAMRIFGTLDKAGEHSNIATEMQNLIKGGVFSGGDSGGDVGTLKRGLMNAINGAPAENEATKNIGKVARAYSAWKIGPSVALQQPSTLGQVAGIAGEGNTIKAIVNNVADKLGIKKIPASDRVVVDNAAVALGGGLDDVLRSEYGAGGSTILNAIEKVTGWKLKSSGTPSFDSAIRRVSAYASLDWVRNSVKKLASGKLNGKAQAALYDELNRFAVPVKEELDDIIARGGEMTPFETSKAIYQFGKKTQYGLSRAELPPTWSGSTLGRVATQLKSFGYEQTQLWARLYAHGKQTGNFSPLIKSIIYTVGINTVSSRAISILLKSPEQRKKETAGSNIMDILGQTLIGPVYSAMRYSGSGTEMLGSAVAGPSISDASQLLYQGGATAVQEAKNVVTPSYKRKHTALRSLAKSVYKKVPPFSIVSQTPVIGPYVNEKLFPTSGTKQFNK